MTYRFAAFLTAVALLVLTGIAVTTREAGAAITDPFDQRFGINANGAVMLRGNTNLRCPAATAGCTDGQAGTATTGVTESLNNNGYVMAHNNTDSDPVTFNHSAATITLPPGGTVLYAALYWSADTKAGTSGAGAPAITDKGKVLLSTPAATGWTTITQDEIFNSGTLTAYQAVADVTSLVSGGGSGTYQVANIQSGTGKDRYAGWALAIAYHDDAQPMRSLRLYDGFGVVSSASTALTIDIGGFQTRQSGAVDTDIGTVVYEGDLGKAGDTLQLDGVSMSDALNPATNFFNSTVSEAASAVTGRSPAWPNLMGVDIDQFNANGKLANNATTASLKLTTATTNGETFYPGVVTFTTELYAPKLVTVITPTDVNGGDVLPGDEIEYRILVRNDGTDTASDSTLIDAIPTGTTFVPGSIAVAGVPGDDSPYSSGKVTFDLGTLTGGQSTYVTFRVRVNDSTRPGASIVNVPGTSYQSSTSTLVLTGVGDPDIQTVKQPDTDLRAAVTVAPSVVQRAVVSNPVSYTITVTNRGPNLEPEPTAVLDLPAGITPQVTMPAGCAASGQRVTCVLGAVASGSSGTVTVPAVADNSATTVSTATLTVSGIGADPVPADNTATAGLRVNDAPQPQPETAGTDGGTPIIIPVRANDSDPDDATGTLTVSVTTPPQHGLTVVNADQTVTYTPDPGWRGDDTFTYTLTDPQLGTGTATVTVTTGNTPPVAADDRIGTPHGQAVTVPVLANDTDANGDTRTLDSVTQPAAGTGSATISGNTVLYVPPSPSFQGTAVFTYTISDGNGGTATGNVRVDVGNTLPVAADDTGAVGYLGTMTLPVLANDTDPDGDTLSIDAVDTPDHGTAQINGTRIDYTAPAGFSGDATFTYTVSDGNGGTATARVMVTVANAPPAAVDKSATTEYGTPVTINAVAGSSDPNGDPRSVVSTTAAAHGWVVRNAGGTLTYTPAVSFSGVDRFDYTLSDGKGGTATARITVTVANGVPVARDDAVTVASNAPATIDVRANDTDPNDDPLTVTIDTPPAHGTARVSGGRVIYTPAPGFVGIDAFTYTVVDPSGLSDTTTVTVTVHNAPPIAVDDRFPVQPGRATTLPVLANDVDPNTGQILTVTSVGAASKGTVRLTGGKVIYTPEKGATGTDTFTYVISDDRGETSEATVTVVIDELPSAKPDTASTTSGTAVDIDVTANDTDPEGGTLTVVAVGRPAHGTAKPIGGKVRYTPKAGFTGKETFSYTVEDAAGHTVTSTITVTVTAAPVLPAAPGKAVRGKPGAPLTITMPSTDDSGHKIKIKSIGTPEHGTARLNSDGTVTYTPKPGFRGTDTFTYEAVDASGNVLHGTITVTVAGTNHPPHATNDAYTTRTGKTITIEPTTDDTDPDKDRLTLVRVGEAQHGTAAADGSGGIAYAPDDTFTGTDTFTYTVGDGHGGTATATVTITVAAHLARTGTNISAVMNTGVVILLLGGVLYTAGTHLTTSPGRHRPGRHRQT